MVSGMEAALTSPAATQSQGMYTPDRAEKPWTPAELSSLLFLVVERRKKVPAVAAELGRSIHAVDTALGRLLRDHTPCPSGAAELLSKARQMFTSPDPAAAPKARRATGEEIAILTDLQIGNLALNLANGLTTEDELKLVLPWPLYPQVIVRYRRVLAHRQAAAPLVRLGQGDNRVDYTPHPATPIVAPDKPFPAQPQWPAEVGDVPAGANTAPLLA